MTEKAEQTVHMNLINGTSTCPVRFSIRLTLLCLYDGVLGPLHW
jgi:hypothetical protein